MNLDPDETEVYAYLKAWPEQYVSAMEICRRAGGRRYRQDPYWAYPVISRLVDAKIVMTDSNNRYKLIPEAKAQHKKRPQRHVAPQIRAIIERSGKVFDLGGPDEAKQK